MGSEEAKLTRAILNIISRFCLTTYFMKIIYLFFFVVSLSACTANKTPCSNYGAYILFHNFDPSKGDTAVFCTAYVKGSNLSNAVDSGTAPVEFFSSSQSGLVTLPSMPAKKRGFDTYDWKLVFRPSGKTVSFTDITFHQISVAQVKYHDHECTND